MHTCNPRTREVEARGSEFQTALGHIVSLRSTVTLSQKQQAGNELSLRAYKRLVMNYNASPRCDWLPALECENQVGFGGKTVLPVNLTP